MKKKIFINYVLMLFIGVLITGVLSLAFIRTSYKNNLEDKLKTNATLIYNSLEYNLKNNTSNYFMLSQEISKQILGEVTFFEKSGKPLADSHNNSIIFEKYNCEHFKKVISNNDYIVYEDYNDFSHENYLYILIPPAKNTNIITRIGISLKDFYKINRIFWIYTTIAIGVGVVIAIILAYFLLNNITKPLEYLNDAAKIMSNGKFDHDIEIHSDDELKNLALSLNKMAHKINLTISELDSKNCQLHSILDSMVHGVIAFDNNYNILLINPSFKNMFNINTLSNANLNNLYLYSYIKSIIEKTLKTKQAQEDKISIDLYSEKVFKINTTILKSNFKSNEKEGVLMIFEDITTIHKFESLRNDFVSNVTHELKTPLTIINGFVETLISKDFNDKSKTTRYLKIISSESERLMKLIEDILFLSKIKSRDINSEMYTLNIYKEIDYINNFFIPIASSKNITIDVDIQKNFNFKVCNKDWFKQMLINLIDNAIKYTLKDGVIRISSYLNDTNFIIKIQDTGIGIPEKDLPRVFERFYRVDKSRSKKAGGTGLGLSIVKHIIKEFAGTISVSSKENIGTEFKITLPLNYGDN